MPLLDCRQDVVEGVLVVNVSRIGIGLDGDPPDLREVIPVRRTDRDVHERLLMRRD